MTMPRFEKGIEVKDSFERLTEAAKTCGNSFRELATAVQSFNKTLKEAYEVCGHFEEGRWVSEI